MAESIKEDVDTELDDYVTVTLGFFPHSELCDLAFLLRLVAFRTECPEAQISNKSWRFLFHSSLLTKDNTLRAPSGDDLLHTVLFRC